MTSFAITVERVYPDRFSIIEDALPSITSPALLGYHTPAYMNMLTRVLHDNPLYLAAFAGGELAAFMPLRWRSGSLGPVINGLPFFGPNGGPVLTQRGQQDKDTILSCLAEDVMLFAREIEAVSLACYTPFLDECSAFESAFRTDRVVERFTQYLDLAGFTGWPSYIRHKSVGRARAKGVTVRVGTVYDVPKFFNIYSSHYQRKGIPLKPEEYFRGVVESLCPAGVARFTVAEWQGEVVACLLTIQSGITISYNVPCCAEHAMTTQANSLLIDESVRALHADGFRFWNWEASASREHPVYKFKSRWGSAEATYKIIINYPMGVKKISGLQAQDILSEYPYYFVIPFEDLGSK
jgi:hypothetical protein